MRIFKHPGLALLILASPAERNAKPMPKLYVKTDRSRAVVDFSHGQPVIFPNLKPTSTAISLRLPSPILARLKVQAHRRGLPYQAHIKNVLADAVSKGG